MTPGMSLGEWDRLGILNRELKIYREYVKYGWSVNILSFGTSDYCYKENAIKIIPVKLQNLANLGTIEKKAFTDASIVKTRQTSKGYYYVRAAKSNKKPIILYGGYIQGQLLEDVNGKTIKTRIYQFLEAWAFKKASLCVVTTREQADWVSNKYQVPRNCLRVVDNFVDDCFVPTPEIAKLPASIVTVGRLEKVKRHEFLLQAAAKAGAQSVTIYGGGSQKTSLEKIAKQLGIQLNLPGNIPNERLPAELSKHELFAMTSVREGHPKALAEALATGMCCVVTDNPGQRAIIEGNVAFLVKDDIEELASVFKYLFGNPSIRTAYGKAAAEYGRNRFGFHHCFQQELAILEEVRMITCVNA